MYSAIEYYQFNNNIVKEIKAPGVLTDAVTANKLLKDFMYRVYGDATYKPHVDIPEGRYVMRLPNYETSSLDSERITVYDPKTGITLESIIVLAYLDNLADKDNSFCIVSYFYGYEPCHVCAKAKDGKYEILY